MRVVVALLTDSSNYKSIDSRTCLLSLVLRAIDHRTAKTCKNLSKILLTPLNREECRMHNVHTVAAFHWRYGVGGISRSADSALLVVW